MRKYLRRKSENGLSNGIPFLNQRAGEDGFTSLAVPVAGVAEVAFFAVEIGMHPGAERRVVFLGTVVSSLPVAVGVVPEGLGDEGEVSGASGHSTK